MTAAAQIRRLPDWPTRLDAHVVARRHQLFAWGRNDCVTFAADAVQAMTGGRPGLPCWGSAREALRLLAGLGGIAAAASSVLPALPAVAMAGRGDVLLVLQADGHLLTVCLGRYWAAPGRDQLIFGDALTALAAWKVG